MRRTTGVSLELEYLQALDAWLEGKETNRSNILNHLLRDFLKKENLLENKEPA